MNNMVTIVKQHTKNTKESLSRSHRDSDGDILYIHVAVFDGG